MPYNHGKDVEEKILDAAFSIFLQKGKAGTKMQEIADKAGVNKALLHYYFRSKDNLYRTVVKQVVEKFILSLIKDLDLSLSFKEILKDFIFNHIGFIRENKQVLQFFMGEMWMNSTEVMHKFQEAMKIQDKSAFVIIMNRIEKAIEDKEIKEGDPFNLLVNILSLDIFFFVLSPMFFLMADYDEGKQEQIVQSREEEVFNFVWESIRLRKEK